MEGTTNILSAVLDALMQACYGLVGNWWVAIFLFTAATKVVLMPISLWCQKNSVLMVSLMPEINQIKVDHFGDKEAIGDLQHEIYKKHGYHPLLSLLPLAIQIVILFGLVDVIRAITLSGQPGTEFLGAIPIEGLGLSWIMPVLAALSSFILGQAQNRINPLQKEQSRAEKASTNGFSIALSAVLGFVVPAGMAFYWICSNLLAIVVQLACNVIYKPAKHVDYDRLKESQKDLADIQDYSKSGKKWYQRDPNAKREKADIARFYNVLDKHIVFYSERSGFYKYFQGAIEWLLHNSSVRIHYITNDPDDQVFELHKTEPRLVPYYVTEKRLIPMMMKMDCDVFVATLADLENYYLKRSRVRDDIEYVFMFHHMTSTFLVGSADCHDHYDTLLCVGPHQVLETQREEEVRSLPKKTLVECGYDLLDRSRKEFAARHAADAKKADECAGNAKAEATTKTDPEHAKPIALIAPSWQDDCILDICAEETIRPLVDSGFKVIVRPHPEYTKRYAPRWAHLQEKLSDIPDDSIHFEQDFSSQDSIFESDILITDWSSISCEFSFTTGRPTIFVDTPMKEGNDKWHELELEPTDISLRNQIGQSVAVQDVGTIGDIASKMQSESDAWRHRIEDIYSQFIFNPGHGGQAAGEYLLDAMLRKQQEAKERA